MAQCRFVSVAASYIILLVIVSASAHADEDSGRTMITRAYALSGLPVWRINREGQTEFDASFVVDVIRRNIDIGAWDKDAFVAVHEESQMLIIRQTQTNHEGISDLLDGMRPK